MRASGRRWGSRGALSGVSQGGVRVRGGMHLLLRRMCALFGGRACPPPLTPVLPPSSPPPPLLSLSLPPSPRPLLARARGGWHGGRGTAGQSDGYHKEIGVSQAGLAARRWPLYIAVWNNRLDARPSAGHGPVCGRPLTQSARGSRRSRACRPGGSARRRRVGGLLPARCGRVWRPGCAAWLPVGGTNPDRGDVEAGAGYGRGVMVNRGGFRGHKYWAGRGKIL